jgi:hypothetical protein
LLLAARFRDGGDDGLSLEPIASPLAGTDIVLIGTLRDLPLVLARGLRFAPAHRRDDLSDRGQCLHRGRGELLIVFETPFWESVMYVGAGEATVIFISYFFGWAFRTTKASCTPSPRGGTLTVSPNGVLWDFPYGVMALGLKNKLHRL